MGARISFVLVSLLAACGGDDGGMNMPMIDSPPASIAAVDPCPGGEAATFTTMASAFSPTSASITMGQVVKFVSTSTHPIGPIAPTDSILAVPENQTKCFRFTAPGTFRFKCNVHGYAGMVTVQ